MYLRSLIFVFFLLFMSVVSLAQHQLDKGSALMKEIYFDTQDIYETELLLVKVLKYESENSVRVLSTAEWNTLQEDIKAMEKKIRNTTDEKDKKELRAKIEYMEARFISFKLHYNNN